MAKYRERFNDGARSGAIAKKQKLKLARQHRVIRRPEPEDLDNSKLVASEAIEIQEKSNEVEPNAPVLIPVTKEAREAKRAELQAMLKPAETKISSAKRKRLDKYIVSYFLPFDVICLLLDLTNVCKGTTTQERRAQNDNGEALAVEI